MPILPAEGFRRPRMARRASRLLARDRPVQREKNRVRCGWRRRHARPPERGCDASYACRQWCPFTVRTRSRHHTDLLRPVIDRCDTVARSQDDRDRQETRGCTRTAIRMPTCGARGVREPRAGLATDDRLHRGSSLNRDAGAPRGSCGAWASASRAGDPDDARFCDTRFFRPLDTSEISRHRGRRSAWRDPRRWLARIRIHPVRPGRVPSRARARQGGTPA